MNEYTRPIRPQDVRYKKLSGSKLEDVLQAMDDANYVRAMEPFQEQHDIHLSSEDLIFMQKMQKVVDYIEISEAKRLNFSTSPSFINSSNATLRIKNMGNSLGLYFPLEDKTYVSAKTFMKASLSVKIKTFLHENAHRHSAASFQFFPSAEGRGKLDYKGSGYLDGSNYRGFNEGLIELYTQILWHKYFGFIKSVFPEAVKDDNLGFPYPEQVEVAQTILKDISDHTTTKWTNVFDMLIRGLFSGEKMWMRIVEKIYGPGSLVFLSSIDVKRTNDNFFFNTKNPTDRIIYAIGSLQHKITDIESLHKYVDYVDRISKVSNNREVIFKHVRESVAIITTKLKTLISTPGVTPENLEILKNMLFIINRRLHFFVKTK